MDALHALEALVEKLGSQASVAEALGRSRKTPLKKKGHIATQELESQILGLYRTMASTGELAAEPPPAEATAAESIIKPSTTTLETKGPMSTENTQPEQATESNTDEAHTDDANTHLAESLQQRSTTYRKKVEAGYELMEGFVDGFTETGLFYRKYTVKNATKTMIVVHGLGEHSGRYLNLVNHFAGKGVNFYLIDNRGHGKSEGKRGHVNHFSEYLDDLRIFVDMVREYQVTEDVYLFGHSMGGVIVSNYLIQRDSYFTGALLSAPALTLAKPAPAIVNKVSGYISQFRPDLTLANGLDPLALSKDKEVIKAYMSDPLVHDRITVRWYHEFLNAGQFAIKNADFIKCPVMVMHGERDKIVSQDGSRALYYNLKGRGHELQIYTGLYHELINELEKAQVLQDIETWMETRSQARKDGSYRPIP